MKHKIKMIRILKRLWKNTDIQLNIRTEQGKLGNWSPELNNANYKKAEKNSIRLGDELTRLRKKYPVSYLEILPTEDDNLSKDNEQSYYGVSI